MRPWLATTALLGLMWAGSAAAQRTRAEITDARETSTLADVVTFLDSLARITPDIRIGSLGTSAQGRSIPYTLAARPLVTDPAGPEAGAYLDIARRIVSGLSAAPK